MYDHFLPGHCFVNVGDIAYIPEKNCGQTRRISAGLAHSILVSCLEHRDLVTLCDQEIQYRQANCAKATRQKNFHSLLLVSLGDFSGQIGPLRLE
jgi:hypothetical protein